MLTYAQQESIFPTFRCLVKTDSGRFIRVIAMFDSGASDSYVTKKLIKEAQIMPAYSTTFTMVKLGSSERVTHDVVEITMKSPINKFSYAFEALVTNDIITLDAVTYDAAMFCDSLLASPFPRPEIEVDVLIGLDNAPSLLVDDAPLVRGPVCGMPTQFGLVLMGTDRPRQTGTAGDAMSWCTLTCSHTLTNETLSQDLKRFWDLESFGITVGDSPTPIEDQTAIDQFQAGITQVKKKYYVPFLWDPLKTKPKNNYHIALSRLVSLERRLSKDPVLKAAYAIEMQKLFDNGTAKKIFVEDPRRCEQYLAPHRAVIKLYHQTTKIRPVFDLSCKDSNGVSVNSSLLPGPKTQTDLAAVLIGFRLYAVALSSDIAKMFHSFGLKEEDRCYQRFLYRTDESKEPDIYQFEDLIFGAKDSPYKAQAGLALHVAKYKTTYPETCKALERATYVDDNHHSKQTPLEALRFVEEATKILEQGNLRLHRWISNSAEVMARIPVEDRAELRSMSITANTAAVDGPELEDKTTTTTLGVQWIPRDDILKYTGFESLIEGHHETKRVLASKIAKLFDPLGLISPFIAKAKMILQYCWIKGYDWDTPLEPSLIEEWESWKEDLRNLKDVIIPRCLIKQPLSKVVDLSLQGFGDASADAFAAAVYLRVQYKNGEVDCNLVMSKSRVAPMERMKIPRLELLAALLNARLIMFVRKAIDIENVRIQCHSDSRTALQWIRKPAAHWQQWVGNRVAEIQGLVEPVKWRHVPGLSNPADLPSRGCTVAQMNDMWFHGPDFMKLPESAWPVEVRPERTSKDLEEAKLEAKSIILRTVGRGIDAEQMIRLVWLNVSDYWKMMRIISYILRVTIKIGERHSQTQIFHSEYQRAVKVCCRIIQKDVFPSEWKSLQLEEPDLDKSSKIRVMTPFYDYTDRLLRVGGRAKDTKIPKGEKHPILLPSRHVWVDKFVLAYHVAYHHPTQEWTLAFLRRRFWMLKGRLAVGHILRNCKPCRIQRATAAKQLMGQLPERRLTPSTPFTDIGLDLMGPVYIKRIIQEKWVEFKSWVVLFTCCTTRGIVLELVISMDTETFIQALRRFTADRTTPQTITSDNATALVRTNKELKVLFATIDLERVKTRMGLTHIEWIFTRPFAPWEGGMYERLIGTVKQSLKKVLGKESFKEWELQTILKEIQNQINSRPLGRVSDQSGAQIPVTPNQLLYGYNVNSLPDIEKPAKIHDFDIGIRWKHRQQVQKSFWNRWHKDYLQELILMKKWHKVEPNLAVGDLVLLSEPKTPRACWNTAIVHEIRPDRHGQVRSVVVRLGNDKRNLLTRPVRMLYPLEIKG